MTILFFSVKALLQALRVKNVEMINDKSIALRFRLQMQGTLLTIGTQMKVLL